MEGVIARFDLVHTCARSIQCHESTATLTYIRGGETAAVGWREANGGGRVGGLGGWVEGWWEEVGRSEWYVEYIRRYG